MMDTKKLADLIQEWLHLKSKAADEGLLEPPIPVELFSADQMERYGVTLALSHELSDKKIPGRLLKRLTDCEKTLSKACEWLTKDESEHQSFSPAREWLLDNFYLIQEQIYAIRRNLPKNYGNALPQLAGSMEGYPRIYDIALQIIEHGDGRWDIENLIRFIQTYQSVTALTLGELWATPITLGIALIENLSKASRRIVSDRKDRNLANDWADRMIEVAGTNPKNLVIVVADMARSRPTMSSAFVAELARRLQGASLALPLSWIEQRLAEEGLSIEQLVHKENKSQAAHQVTISNSISGLRNLANVNWRNFVEAVSVVEKMLRQDPTETYSKMDFETRDQYRHAVERLARQSKKSEFVVAEAAIKLANTALQENVSEDETRKTELIRKAHVGYYLIGNGISLLEQKLGIFNTILRNIFRANQGLLTFCYIGVILLITSGFTFALLLKAKHIGLHSVELWILSMALFVANSQLAIGLVNLIITLSCKPKMLPKMDFIKGIPSEYRTLVVVPAMLSSIQNVESLIDALEVRYLGNRDDNVLFGLLTDFNDASNENMPSDTALLSMAEFKIKALNTYHKTSTGNDIFYLFHRPRQWNAKENVWMGRERKRGKLADLNDLLCGSSEQHFSSIVGDVSQLKTIKYVITLDSDTQLPRESAQQLIGTMVHPLNIPFYDIKKNRVVRGHAILQPRIAEALPTSGMNYYVKLYGNEFGIDPYTRTISDVYQDLFDEGSFIGKGIYDVKLFQQILAKNFPDNQILSHDLLEGCYLRSGFISDVALYEKSPNNYLADTQRRSRWIRGDWQLINWLFPFVRDQAGTRIKNPLSGLSKFKIFDNLRRSMVPIALLVLFGLTWFSLPSKPFWISVILLIILLPAISNIVLQSIRKPKDMLFSQHFVQIGLSIRYRTAQQILFFSFLPHEAWYSLLAILRTIWRLSISKCHLLEWVPSDQVDVHSFDTKEVWLKNMWMGPIFAFCVLIASFNSIQNVILAAPFIILWLMSPFSARWISRPYVHKVSKLNEEQKRFLHRMARITWGFFETFVNDESHWLPPDNYQEMPVAVLAKRTSPTNIGLSLLANLTAYDFGYITIQQLLERIRNTVLTLNNMERYRGHLYNWYSTETLQPLLPRYVSSVDSGNYAAHLLTLRQGLLTLPDEPIINDKALKGLEDTLEILSTTIIHHKPLTDFKSKLNEIHFSLTNGTWSMNRYDELSASALELVAKIHSDSNVHHESSHNDKFHWAEKLREQCDALRNEVKLFIDAEELTENVTLRQLAQNPINTMAIERMELIQDLAQRLYTLAQVDMRFLFDEANHLMTIGFNVDEQRRDPSNYDLLSSEARLGNFIAIAQGQVQQDTWFALGRLLVSGGHKPILISWSGSMFEYLMPLLVMPTYPGTLLDQTYHEVIKQQIAYGSQKNVPWGVSESGFNAVDNQYNYLYRAFGVPGLGLKRGLEEDLVIAPYASAMALMVDPKSACLNLQRLAKEYALGKYGFYEAIDYTKTRLPHDSKRALVRSFMAHHQGMSFLSFSHVLHLQPMQRRFITDPQFQATLLLLQERIPRPNASYLKIPKAPSESVVLQRHEASIRTFTIPHTRTPQVQLLSNGRYHVVITQAGGGYSRWKDYAITRWREDCTRDNWGLFGYICDVESGDFWSAAYQPTLHMVKKFKTIFSESHVEFSGSEAFLDMHTEIVVSPEDDIELRRLRIHNRSKIQRIIEFTSYAEVVLAPQNSDIAQPAFNNLFVETEILAEQHAILAMRRPQDDKQNPPWLCHLLNVYTDLPYDLSYETDRARFIGRCNNLTAPAALLKTGELSNTQGAVLDPIVAIRCRVKLEPDALVTFDLINGVTATRSQCIELIQKYQDRRLANRIFGLAWTHGQVLLHQLNITKAEAQLYSKLASSVIYTNNVRRADPRVLASNRRGQSGLWGYAISGDFPIVLLQIEDAENIELVRQLIDAQAYWRYKGLIVDLIIINEEHISYRQVLQDQIMGLITSMTRSDQMGSIVVRIAEQVPLEDYRLFQTVAKVILSDKRGTLKDQLIRRPLSPSAIPDLVPSKLLHFTDHHAVTTLPKLPSDLQFFNGLGGFNAIGNEYIIRLTEDKTTPAPWVNVIANKKFGSIVSENGQGYTWIENAHEFRLTPWENDPVQDLSGEAIYLRDDETGLIWSPTALPCRGKGDYQIRHGFGYSVFEHIEEGIYSELTIFVALDASIKFMVLKLRNLTMQNRRISAYGYTSWVLGDLRFKNAMHVVTEISQSGAILALNHYNAEFGERVAFFNAVTTQMDLLERTVTGDRAEFIGRNGTLKHPIALTRTHLSGKVGAGFDPCAAIQLTFDLAANQSREIVFTLGADQNKSEVENLLQRYHGSVPAQATLSAVKQFWHQTLNVVQVMTPDPALNLMANGWLLYQVLSSRLWGRSGYYQSGGAFGFRDQLQDVMALAHITPDILRSHILLCAAHQFEAGDVQHWWHPPKNRGVRTRCSDDYLWLPHAICQYIEVTGDKSILNETIPFLKGRLLNPNEESYYDLPIMGSPEEAVSLYQHAVRAIQHGLRFGEHGLPLMGSGDWNDGMNLVGIEGKGESIWLGFFLYDILRRFANIALEYKDQAFADTCTLESVKLKQNLENHGWDGKWYRRAYFDDGSPLGSKQNTECKIDSIAQSWSVLSGVADPIRAKTALDSLYQYLVNANDRIVKLLDPPFDKSKPNPGYIQGYLPGIRENGGQYTHAGVWAAMAFAKLSSTEPDEKEKAWQLFQMLNPINHGRNLDEIQLYKIEPYVIAADIYSVAPHIGRGGWNWYTGSAGWFYRFITETLLGMHLYNGDKLHIAPVFPDDWHNFTIHYRYKSSLYKIEITRDTEKSAIEDNLISLVDDGQEHIVKLTLRG